MNPVAGCCHLRPSSRHVGSPNDFGLCSLPGPTWVRVVRSACAPQILPKRVPSYGAEGSERSEQARGEIFGMLGEMLGLTPEQQAELMSEESQERMREELREMEGNLRELFRRMAESGEGSEGPGASPTSGFSFFSLN